MIKTSQNEQASKIGNWIASRLDNYEIILVIITLVALSLKLFTSMHISVLIVLSLLSLAVLYFFNGFASINNDKADSFEVFLHKISSWACSVGIIGILYGINNWAFYQLFAKTGAFALILVLILFFILKRKRDDLIYFNTRHIIRITIICIISLLMAYTSSDFLRKII